MKYFWRRLVCRIRGHQFYAIFPFACQRCHKYWWQMDKGEWRKALDKKP